MNPWNRLSLQAASIILTLVSIVFTVLLWSQLPEEGWMKIISGLAGFALELCKFSLLPLSLLLLKNRETMNAGALLFLFGSSLFVVSIGASVAFLENGEQARQQQGAVWQGRQTTLTQLDDRIRIAQSAAEKDIDGGYRQRGLDTLEQVEQWQEQRQALLSEPVALNKESAGAIGLGESQRFYAWLLLAILIDGCAVAGWVVLSQEDSQEEKQEEKEEEKIKSPVDVKEADASEQINQLEARLEAFLIAHERKEKLNKALSETLEPEKLESKPDSQVAESIKETVTTTETETEETVSKKTKTKLMIVEREMLERITSGEHGELLTIRGLMKKENIGYAKAKQVVNSLKDDGVLVDTGKGYQLALVDENQQSLNYV